VTALVIVVIGRPGNTTNDWMLRSDPVERIKLSFDKHGISIPYTQRDAHMHNVA
jgi:small-conductance mechanosensitive channel